MPKLSVKVFPSNIRCFCVYARELGLYPVRRTLDLSCPIRTGGGKRWQRDGGLAESSSRRQCGWYGSGESRWPGRQGSRSPCECPAQLGTRARRGPSLCLSGRGPAKARASGVDSPATRGNEAPRRARHPKKGRGLLCQGIDVRFGFVAKHRGMWPVEWLTEALGVSRAGFYAW